tara:strand:- start:1186 stop:1590 length:405 start_codon:yes stop_codon:yes gene_type:complete
LRNDDWLPPLLREYAKWLAGEFGEGFSSTSTIWRAFFDPSHGSSQSTLPKGVVPPPGFSKLQRAYNFLLINTKYGNDVSLVRAFYLCEKPEIIMQLFNISRRTFYRRKSSGERAIRQYLKNGKKSFTMAQKMIQ